MLNEHAWVTTRHNGETYQPSIGLKIDEKLIKEWWCQLKTCWYTHLEGIKTFKVNMLVTSRTGRSEGIAYDCTRIFGNESGLSQSEATP